MTTKSAENAAAEKKAELLAKVDTVYPLLDAVRDLLAEIAADEDVRGALQREREAVRAEVKALREEHLRLKEPLKVLAQMKAELTA